MLFCAISRPETATPPAFAALPGPAERHIMIIPEIDMPGHADAATRAYPQLSGGSTKKYVGFTFNPGSEACYDFLTDVLSEVAALFPSPYIHFGGDEVHFGNQCWDKNKDVLALMKREQLKDRIEVEHYFAKRISKNEEVRSVLEEFVAFDGPAFLEVMVDQTAHVYPMIGPGAGYKDMITGKSISSRPGYGERKDEKKTNMF